MNKKLRSSRGQIAVMYAGVVAVLLGAVGLCTDVGIMYMNWQQLQKAADAAVLAGANYLPNDPSTATTTATNWAENNFSIASGEIASGPTVGGTNNTITMTLSRTVPYNFAKVLGLTNGAVEVTATAALEGIGGVVGSPNGGHLVPFGFTCASPPCTTVGENISLPGNTTQQSPGNWGGIQYNDGQQYTGSHYSGAVQNGYEGSAPILLGTASGVQSVTGNDINNFGPSGLAARYNAGSLTLPLPNPLTAANLSDPRLIEIPMVSTFGNGKSITLDITGFITAILIPDGQGGYYAQVLGITLGDQIGSTTAPSTGTTTPVLIQ